MEVKRKDGLRVEWHFSKTEPSTHTFELTYIAKGVARVANERDLIPGGAPCRRSTITASNPAGSRSSFRPHRAEPPTLEMRGVKTWTETHSDARVLVTANDIGKNGWLEVWTRMPRGSVIDVTPAWQQRQLRYQEYRRPAVIAAAIVFFAGLVVLFGIRQNYDSPPRDIQTARVFAGPPDAAHPAIAGALTANGSLHLEHAMGTLFALASAGVIDIREEAKGPFRQRKFTIRKGHASRPLAPHEQALLNEVFSAKGASEREVPLDKARTHLVRHFSKLKAIVAREMTDEGLFDDGRRQIRRRYSVVGIVLLVLAGLALVPAIVLVGPRGPLAVLVAADDRDSGDHQFHLLSSAHSALQPGRATCGSVARLPEAVARGAERTAAR